MFVSDLVKSEERGVWDADRREAATSDGEAESKQQSAVFSWSQTGVCFYDWKKPRKEGGDAQECQKP